MSKRAPSTTQLLVIAGFALSCFGILLFLWITFGGPTPFKAKPYQIKVPFTEAAQLAQQSDVRISGVSVGKVQSIGVAPNGRQSMATIDIDDKYAPLPESTRALLRTKTLLGETYVELTPGSRNGPKLQDGETLPEANVTESVQLDEIFRTFNPRTRAAFQEWMQNAAIAIQGRGQDFSSAFGELAPTLTSFNNAFRTLDSNRLALHQLFRNGAITFKALRGREGEVSQLVQNANNVFQTTASRDDDIEALFRAFPTFEDESRLTLERLKKFSIDADPLMKQLVPTAQQLSPTLIAFSKLAPEAKGFFEGLGPVIARSSTGFPALRKFFRDDFPVLLRALDPFLRNINPILTGLNLYKHEITAVMANVAATIAAVHLSPSGEQLHFIRAMGPFEPESLATFPHRLTSNRTSAYSQPLADARLAEGLPSFSTGHCSSGITATLNPNTPNEAAFNERVQGDVKKATSYFESLKKYAFGGGESTASTPAPGCVQQAPFAPIYGSGPSTTYQHTFEQTGQP
jgi:phospholipid/cholesterol/gamma-HCH transport system substrate-binding protein